jgi:hypothetical protein
VKGRRERKKLGKLQIKDNSWEKIKKKSELKVVACRVTARKTENETDVQRRYLTSFTVH